MLRLESLFSAAKTRTLLYLVFALLVFIISIWIHRSSTVSDKTTDLAENSGTRPNIEDTGTSSASDDEDEKRYEYTVSDKTTDLAENSGTRPNIED
ncbi:MAG: hypothetical protein JRF37_05490, partial [Deltaproteobacteria bacterium]|nr:hypothetical protein [Deltaproteobacteria bacterium]